MENRKHERFIVLEYFPRMVVEGGRGGILVFR